MNKKLVVVVIVTILAGIGLFASGFFFSQVNAQANQQDWMMGNWNGQTNANMMRNGQFGPGMMGGGQYDGMMGMMMGGQYGSGMMANFGDLTDVDPLSIEEVETAVTNYLSSRNDENLSLGEIMIFDNHAYAQIIDETTETGAFEVLVDPVTGNVFPEPGPNMMWNTQYGMMAGSSSGMMGGQLGSGMMGGSPSGNMMGSFGYAPNAEFNITAEEAVGTAQSYLDAYLPGKTADEHADTFPGYYTLHVLEDGETIGMLSVNAYTGQVFLHQWHGNLIEMVGAEHD